MRLRVMFLAFCKHFGLNAEEIRSPFSEEIDLYERIVPDDDLFTGQFRRISTHMECCGIWRRICPFRCCK